MSDYIVRAMAAGDQIRALAVTSRDMVEQARQNHNTSPICTAALGRMLSAGAMMGAMMKGESDLLTLQIQGGGPMRGITVTADSMGNVKGFPNVNDVMLPPNSEGKLDVGGAIGVGILRVIRDMGMKDPYVGTCELKTGEIAEDLTYYFATSEQIPSSVGLGVLMNKNNTVDAAGGFIIQLMPFTDDKTIDRLEENIRNLKPVTTYLSEGKTPEDILGIVLDGLDVEIQDIMDTRFKCDCSVERIERSLCSLAMDDIKSIIDDGKPVEIKCQFCNKAYNFSIDDIKKLRGIS